MRLPFRKKKRVAPETPQETLARLTSVRRGQNTFGMEKGGYDVAEVDAFLATVESRTVPEIQRVLFRLAGRSQGYRQNEVDRHLDDLVARRRRIQGPL